jgi:bacterial/archaeal transporter family-2 protein
MTGILSPGLIVAVLTGTIFAVVTTIEGAIGRSVGPINATILEHVLAGIIAIVAIIFIFSRGSLTWEMTKPVLFMSLVAGVLVILAVGGVSYAFQHIGVAAGNLALVFGQMGLAVVIDAIGVAGYDKIPLTPTRLFGLLLMAAGIYFVLPKNG